MQKHIMLLLLSFIVITGIVGCNKKLPPADKLNNQQLEKLITENIGAKWVDRIRYMAINTCIQKGYPNATKKQCEDNLNSNSHYRELLVTYYNREVLNVPQK